jgi:hypothetical protein
VSEEPKVSKGAVIATLGAFIAGAVIFSGGGEAPGSCLAAINAAERSFSIAGKAFNTSSEITRAAGNQDAAALLEGNKQLREMLPKYRAAIDDFKQYSGECREAE